MGISIKLGEIMAMKNVGLTELSDKVGLSLANLSTLKSNRAKAIRFTTLDAICRALDCQPGDLLEYSAEAETELDYDNGVDGDGDEDGEIL